jgi:hypothetical protein
VSCCIHRRLSFKWLFNSSLSLFSLPHAAHNGSQCACKVTVVAALMMLLLFISGRPTLNLCIYCAKMSTQQQQQQQAIK